MGLLCGARDLETTVASFEDVIGDLELEQDVSIEIRGRTEADLLAGDNEELEALRHVLPLLGAPPHAILAPDSPPDAGSASPRRPFSHGDLDARARELAAAIAHRIHTDPSLVARARAHIAQRLPHASTGEQRDLREWDRILRAMSLPRLRRFLVDPGERATRLRQTFPFTGILSAEEREELLEAHRRGEQRVAPDPPESRP